MRAECSQLVNDTLDCMCSVSYYTDRLRAMAGSYGACGTRQTRIFLFHPVTSVLMTAWNLLFPARLVSLPRLLVPPLASAASVPLVPVALASTSALQSPVRQAITVHRS
jgi:hypothetical protein